MPSRKDRLYVALYARGGAPTMPGLEDTYHWALLIGPKVEDEDSKGARFHAKEKMQPGGVAVWEYEERESSMLPTSMLLVRVMICKIQDRRRLESIFRNIPVRAGVNGWNCVAWVKEAIETARGEKGVLGTAKSLEWNAIRDAAMEYVERKKRDHRFDGQGNFDQDKAATWDMIEGVERMP